MQTLNVQCVFVRVLVAIDAVELAPSQSGLNGSFTVEVNSR